MHIGFYFNVPVSVVKFMHAVDIVGQLWSSVLAYQS